MGEFMHDDICEQILVRLDVKDLFRYKSVCKSWKSLISHPHFAKAHHRRQVNLNIPYPMAIIPYNYLSKYGLEYYMVGSSYGLACITSFDGDEIIVANPWTREERILPKRPRVPQRSCWGFGYDSLTDDYKVVFGEVEIFKKTTFYVLSLKSNVWKHVGHVNHTCFSVVQIGTLCNGALHWVMCAYQLSAYRPTKVFSFDLSKEVFKEINQPDDSMRKCSFFAINEEWVRNKYSGHERWETKKYNVKLYYEYIVCQWILMIEDRDPGYTFISTTVMPSLISPHLQEGNEQAGIEPGGFPRVPVHPMDFSDEEDFDLF